jgi:hypothetical protein
VNSRRLAVLLAFVATSVGAQTNQWTNMGGWINTTRGWLDWTQNSYDGRRCLFSGAPRWNGSDNAVMCWNATTNVWEETFRNDNSSKYPATPIGGDEGAWFFNPRTKEYVTLDMAHARPQSYAFSMVTRLWRPIGDTDIAGLSARTMPWGSGTAYSPDHNVVVITHGGQYVPAVTRVIDFKPATPTYTELRTGLPPGRVLIQNMFVYASSLRKFVLWGGYGFDAANVLNDLWLLDPVTWTWSKAAQVNPPPARDNAHMAYDPVQNIIYLHGGLLASGQSEPSIVWILDLNQTPFKWTALPVPSGTAGVNYPQHRYNGAATFDPQRGFCVVGGSVDNAVNWWDTLFTWCFQHKLSADTVPPNAPPAGSGAFTPSGLGDLAVAWSRSSSDTGNASTTDVVKYEVSRSEDGGITWKDLQAVLASGATQYTFTYRSIPTSQVRVRSIDSSNNASTYTRIY